MRRKAWLWLAVLALICSCALADSPVVVDRVNQPKEHADFAFAEDAALLEVYFPHIMNCDAALLRCGGETMLIDCASAEYAPRVVQLLEYLGITEVDCVVNTHPHYDHLEGLETLAQAVKVKELRICFPEDSEKQMDKAMQTAQQYGIPVSRYADGDQWTLGGAKIDVWLKGDKTWCLNDRSAVMRVQFGRRTMLFTADAERSAMMRLAEIIPPEELDIDIMKFPHHGKNALNVAFREKTSPLLCVITNTDTTKHKSIETLRRHKIPYVCTTPGILSLRCDGATWLVERTELTPARLQ